MAAQENNSSTATAARLLDQVVVDDIEDRGSLDDGATGSRLKEPWKGEYAKSILYAGLDAIITCFSLISSISASRLTSADVLVLGFANLVADGISMGAGDFVSSTSEKDVAAKEMAVTEWDVIYRGGLEKMELVQKYQALGMDIDDAAMIVSIFAKYKDIMVQEKMMAHGGLPLEEEEKPWKNGLVTFAAFLLFGSAPLLSFIVLIPFTNNDCQVCWCLYPLCTCTRTSWDGRPELCFICGNDSLQWSRRCSRRLCCWMDAEECSWP